MIEARVPVTVTFQPETVSVEMAISNLIARLSIDEARELSYRIDQAVRECTADNSAFRVQQAETHQNRHIDELELSVRTSNCLRSENLVTVGDVRAYGLRNLRQIKHMGRKSIRELQEVFEHLHIDLEE